MTDSRDALSPAPSGGEDAGATAVAPMPEGGRQRWSIAPVIRRVIAYLGGAALLGVLGGALWHAVVRLPSYTLGSDGTANTTERGLTQFFSVDAWYCGVGVACGLLLGLACWWAFRRLGAWSTLIALAGALLAASIALHLGEALGPSNFSARISSAHAGQHVPIDFRLHTHVTVLVWLLAADFPVLLFSALTRDADDEDSRHLRWRALARVRRVRAHRQMAAGRPGTPGHPVVPDDQAAVAGQPTAAPRVAPGC